MQAEDHQACGQEADRNSEHSDAVEAGGEHGRGDGEEAGAEQQASAARPSPCDEQRRAALRDGR